MLRDADIGLSVIIPVHNDDAKAADLLERLSRMDVDEIIVADSRPRQRPYALLSHAGRTPVTWLTAPKGRGPQIAAGIDVARNPLLWILHADSQPHGESVPDLRYILSDRKTALGCFPLVFSIRHPWLDLFAALSRFDSKLTTFGDQGFFFRRADYEALDLDLRQYPLLEDVALRQALKTRGQLRKSGYRLTTSARRFRKYGYLRTQWRNLDILLRYWRGESPEALYHRYYGTTPRTVPEPPPSSTVHRV